MEELYDENGDPIIEEEGGSQEEEPVEEAGSQEEKEESGNEEVSDDERVRRAEQAAKDLRYENEAKQRRIDALLMAKQSPVEEAEPQPAAQKLSDALMEEGHEPGSPTVQLALNQEANEKLQKKRDEADALRRNREIISELESFIVANKLEDNPEILNMFLEEVAERSNGVGVGAVYEMYKSQKPIPQGFGINLKAKMGKALKFATTEVGTSKRKKESDERVRGRAKESDAAATSSGGGRSADQDYANMTYAQKLAACRYDPFKQ
ncbi:MAG: hypothetical protein JRL30_27630 [Deltaproteobacteria bacterium]|nr:hypothetical protein [Deltaproteobacteria bacterium]